MRPDPSPTLGAPTGSSVPVGGSTSGAQNGVPPTGGAAVSGRRTNGEQATDAEIAREREAREARLRANEERLRSLIRDICTGCDYGTLRSGTVTNAVRAKG